MPECDYCDASFAEEDAYLDHLADTHFEELSPVDRRKVEHASSDRTEAPLRDTLSSAPAILAIILLIAGGILAYVTFGFGASRGKATSQKPSNLGSVHYHGTISMVVTGTRIDFSRPRYQVQAKAFHFEGGNGRRWHVHAQGVTLH